MHASAHPLPPRPVLPVSSGRKLAGAFGPRPFSSRLASRLITCAGPTLGLQPRARALASFTRRHATVPMPSQASSRSSS